VAHAAALSPNGVGHRLRRNLFTIDSASQVPACAASAWRKASVAVVFDGLGIKGKSRQELPQFSFT